MQTAKQMQSLFASNGGHPICADETENTGLQELDSEMNDGDQKNRPRHYWAPKEEEGFYEIWGRDNWRLTQHSKNMLVFMRWSKELRDRFGIDVKPQELQSKVNQTRSKFRQVLKQQAGDKSAIKWKKFGLVEKILRNQYRPPNAESVPLEAMEKNRDLGILESINQIYSGEPQIKEEINTDVLTPFKLEPNDHKFETTDNMVMQNDPQNAQMYQFIHSNNNMQESSQEQQERLVNNANIMQTEQTTTTTYYITEHEQQTNDEVIQQQQQQEINLYMQMEPTQLLENTLQNQMVPTNQMELDAEPQQFENWQDHTMSQPTTAINTTTTDMIPTNVAANSQTTLNTKTPHIPTNQLKLNNSTTMERDRRIHYGETIKRRRMSAVGNSREIVNYSQTRNFNPNNTMPTSVPPQSTTQREALVISNIESTVGASDVEVRFLSELAKRNEILVQQNNINEKMLREQERQTEMFAKFFPACLQIFKEVSTRNTCRHDRSGTSSGIKKKIHHKDKPKTME